MLVIVRDLHLTDSTAISPPPATRTGQVDRRASRDRRSRLRLPVRVNIHYMNGNHDWYFHLPGANFDSIRQKVIDRLGLRNSVSSFPHDPSESTTIQSIFAQHQVYARHGDIFDPFSDVKEKGRNYACLTKLSHAQVHELPGVLSQRRTERKGI